MTNPSLWFVLRWKFRKIIPLRCAGCGRFFRDSLNHLLSCKDIQKHMEQTKEWYFGKW